MNTENDIRAACDELRDMLLAKNQRYGDSALNPVRIMSRASPVEQILTRIDDKLSRLARGSGQETEDVELDLLGYFLLLRVARKRAMLNEIKLPTPAVDGEEAPRRAARPICDKRMTYVQRGLLGHAPCALDLGHEGECRVSRSLFCGEPCEYIMTGSLASGAVGSCSGSCTREPGHTGAHQCKRGTQQGHVTAAPTARTCGNPCSGFDGSARCPFVCLLPRQHEGVCQCHAHRPLP